MSDTPRSTEIDHTLAEVLAGHRYRGTLGDYEIEPYYKHFGCSCGWEQNIAGMNGYWSWIAAHEAHVAAAIAEVFGRVAVGFKPDGWGSNDTDRARLWGLSAALHWMRGEPVTRPGSSPLDGVGDQQ